MDEVKPTFWEIGIIVLAFLFFVLIMLCMVGAVA